MPCFTFSIRETYIDDNGQEGAKKKVLKILKEKKMRQARPTDFTSFQFLLAIELFFKQILRET